LRHGADIPSRESDEAGRAVLMRCRRMVFDSCISWTSGVRRAFPAVASGTQGTSIGSCRLAEVITAANLGDE
jgi:hypothetical protein